MDVTQFSYVTKIKKCGTEEKRKYEYFIVYLK